MRFSQPFGPYCMLFTTISDLKDVLEATLHLSRDALHVHIVNTMFWPTIGLVAGPQILRILRPIRESRVATVPPRMPDSARSAP